jgi:hypothetical protein
MNLPINIPSNHIELCTSRRSPNRGNEKLSGSPPNCPYAFASAAPSCRLLRSRRRPERAVRASAAPEPWITLSVCFRLMSRASPGMTRATRLACAAEVSAAEAPTWSAPDQGLRLVDSRERASQALASSATFPPVPPAHGRSGGSSEETECPSGKGGKLALLTSKTRQRHNAFIGVAIRSSSGGNVPSSFDAYSPTTEIMLCRSAPSSSLFW